MALKKITYDVEQKILELASSGMPKEKIAKTLRIGRTAVFKTLREYRVPEVDTVKVAKKIKSLNDLISVRLLYFCDDFEMLSKRLAVEILYQKPEKIIISRRLQSVVNKEKIDKVVNILDRIDLHCNFEYAGAL
jgi:predicted transcriptional regulator